MSYKIAVVSSDGENIDLSFGAAASFYIYEASGNEHHFDEKRIVHIAEGSVPEHKNGNGCGFGEGCGSGGGCGNNGGFSPKVELISDCRCIVCKKIGFHITKQLEKKAITGFDVECTIEEALVKIANYYDKLDSHKSLRGSANKISK